MPLIIKADTVVCSWSDTLQTCQVLKMDTSETTAYHAVCRTVCAVWHTITSYICSGWIPMAVIMGGSGVLPQKFFKFSF